MNNQDAKGRFLKGVPSGRKGIKLTLEHRRKISGKNNGHWKGENASYSSKHKWVTNHFGKPKKCEHCGTTTAKKFEWANISQLYKRIRKDWIRLCTKCHQKQDNRNNTENRLKRSVAVKKWWDNRRANYA